MKNLLGTAVLCAATLAAAAELSNLTAEYRDGQVFLRWDEKNLPPRARLSVWASNQPITQASSPEQIAEMLNPGSARDWWLNPDSFLVPRSQKLKSEEIFAGAAASEADKGHAVRGFIIRNGGKPIPPSGGLHVHTVAPEEKGARYYAVSWQDGPDSPVRQRLALASPVEVKPAPIQPITLKGKVLPRGSAAGKPLILSLHGRGGGVGIDRKGREVGTHLLFLDRTLAWREGIPMKFSLQITRNAVYLTPNDRIWIGRKLEPGESGDARDYVPAIATFWLGYNRNIARGNRGPDFQVDNYTERWLLFLVRWCQEHLGTDPNRTYVSGGSMGGTGAVQLATHFPEVFAAVRALVPVYSYTWRKMPKASPSVSRMLCSCGPFSPENPARMPDGRDLLEYASGERNIARAEVDYPPIFATNGRRDTSMPWVNNPPFYRAANQARQAFTVYWNNGNHAMSGARPKDMAYSDAMLFRYRLDASFPAFSNVSSNRNYGEGNAADGDPEGWLNRGMLWRDTVETQDRYGITLEAAYPGITYPVTADVTIRRRRAFKVKPGEKLTLSINGRAAGYTVPADGLLTVRQVTFPDAKPVRLEFKR